MEYGNGFKKSAFGELLTASPHCEIQIDAVYGLRLKTDITTFTDTGASGALTLNTNSNGTKEFKVSSGTGSATYCIMNSKRTVRYRPGQGIRFAFTGRFTTGVANNSQRIGAWNQGNEASFGYLGTAFGLFFRTGGLPAIYSLTVSAGAGGAENATVTLNGVAKVVAITAGSAAFNAAELAKETYTGWIVSSLGAVVTFVAQNDSTFAGAFTLTSTGTCAGTFATTYAGLTSSLTTAFVANTSWNIDKCNGLGPSGFNIDPTKGNVFQIKMQYLGYGPITYSVENESGVLFPVHRTMYPNSNVTPTFSIPNFKTTIISVNTGNTTSISCYSSSMAGFIDGNPKFTRDLDSRSFSKANIGTTSTPILSIRNKTVFNNTFNMTSLSLSSLSGAIDGAKPGTIELILNAVLTGVVWTSHDATNSIVSYDTTATALSIGSNSQIMHSFNLSKAGDFYAQFDSFEQIFEAGDSITIAAKSSSTTIDVTCSLDWQED